ncbi:MAG TPA: MFS transporter [Solirubrobacteraceae bacterium]
MSAASLSLRAALRTRFGGLPAVYWRIWTGTLVNRAGTFVEPFLALYLTTVRGLSIPAAGAVVAVYGAGCVIAQPLGGTLADRVGRRATMTAGLCLSGVGLAALGAARDPVLITVIGFLLGAFGDAYRPASQAAVADLVPVEDRRRASGLQFWAVNLGFSVAAVTGGFLAEAGYGLLFALDAATCLIFGAIVWVAIPETRPAAAARAGGRGYGAVLRDRLMVAYALVAVGQSAVLFQIFSVLPLSMRGDGLSTATYGAVVALNGLLIVLLHPIVAPHALRRAPSHVLAAGTLVIAAGSALAAPANAAVAWVAVVAVFTLGEILVSAVIVGVVAEIAPPALRGRYQGALGFAFSAAVAITPLAGTQLLGDRGDAPWPWLAGAALGALAAAAYLALGPALRRRRTAVGAA